MVGEGAEMLIIFERQTENVDVLKGAAASHKFQHVANKRPKKTAPWKELVKTIHEAMTT